jgi:hypothetical protein
MKEIDLLRFIQNNEIEYHWHDDNVIMFISHWDIKEFMDIIGHTHLTNGETPCMLRYGYIAIWMKDICGDFDIDMEKVFEKK